MGGICLNIREYKSSVFDRVLFGLIALSILMPGSWVVLYSIEKRSYNWPMVIAGLVLCSYTIFLLQKFFSYRVVVYHDYIEIYRFDKVIRINFIDIVDIYQKRNACYIIDRVMKDGNYYIRGTNDVDKISSEKDKVSISIFKLPVLQRAYIDNYDELIQHIYSKIGKEYTAVKRVRNKKSSFVSAALLENVDHKSIGGMEIFKIFVPYIVLLLIIFFSLAEYGIASKGINQPELNLYARNVFPVLIILAISILIINFIYYFIRLLNKDLGRISIRTSSILVFVISNFILSAGVIAVFFIVFNNIRL
jgi:hypothetical protein